MAIRYSPKIVTDSLRGICDAANSRSYPGTGTAWSDLSTYGNGWTHTNVTYNSAGYFTYNGTTSYSTMNPSTPVSFSGDNASSSIGVWFRPHTVTPAANMAVITDNFGPEWGIWVLTNGNATAYAYGGVGSAVTANQWVYIVLTADVGVPTTGSYTGKLYKNGAYINQVTGTNGNGLNDWPLTLGFDSKSGAPENYFDGDIARVEIYQKVLSASEVKQNFDAVKGRYGI